MENFTFDISTVVNFGRGQIKQLKFLKQSGKSVLIVYGGGSIKRNGIYDAAVNILKENQIEIYELAGVKPNPKIDLVRIGVDICRKNSIDMVLAIGGGSSIDTAKLVAAGACFDGDPWKLMEDSSRIKAALPVYVVLTLAATGSEMDDSTVISDNSIKRKLDICSEFIKPKMAVLDPAYTFSVPKEQTAAGAVDIMSHVFENYFTNVKGADIQAQMCLAVLKTVIKNAPIAIEKPDDYDARANLMWCSSMALNGILSYGADVKWCVHPIEHELSAFYDITHGVGLAIITPVWMRYILSEKTAAKIAGYGRTVWNIPYETSDLEAAKAAIEKTKDFFESIGMPEKLSQIGIGEEHFEEMAEHAWRFCDGCYVPLTKRDIVEIYKKAL